jgi:hypothetical protein
MRPALAEAVESFRSSEMGQLCQDPEWSTGMCAHVAHAFVNHLFHHGIWATVVKLDANRSAVQVDGLVLDWTARQFDPTAELPAVVAHALPGAGHVQKWALGPPAAS